MHYSTQPNSPTASISTTSPLLWRGFGGGIYGKELQTSLQGSEIAGEGQHGLTLVPALENEYQYKYNGKELQTELDLNVYDYGWRQYDPTIARWQAVDNLSEDYYSHSVYNYVLGNPVIYIDPDGNSVTDIWELNIDTGLLTRVEENQDVDVLYLVDEGGNRVKDDDGIEKSFTMERPKQIIEREIKMVRSGIEGVEDIEVEFYSFENADLATGFFEFLSDNQNTKNENELFEYEINGELKAQVSRNKLFEGILTTKENGNLEYIAISLGYESRFKNFDLSFRANTRNRGKTVKSIRHTHSHPFNPHASKTDENTASGSRITNFRIYYKGEYIRFK